MTRNHREIISSEGLKVLAEFSSSPRFVLARRYASVRFISLEIIRYPVCIKRDSAAQRRRRYLTSGSYVIFRFGLRISESQLRRRRRTILYVNEVRAANSY